MRVMWCDVCSVGLRLDTGKKGMIPSGTINVGHLLVGSSEVCKLETFPSIGAAFLRYRQIKK
jgi:hypothetical protein